jgi:hypothetical protein
MTPADGNPGADPPADPAIDAPPLLSRLAPPLPPIIPYIPQGPRPAAVSPEILEVLAELRKPPASGGRWNNFVLLLVTLFLF